MWSALATIVVMFIKAKYGRKVLITTKDNKVIHAEGLTKEELDPILKEEKNVATIDTGNDHRMQKSCIGYCGVRFEKEITHYV